ncbi:hypothetical protein IFR04_003621 [Cadophora malorum]|uniref:Uncharacterized protein n=1 Tax=Cadophora malorum TaxID=108018 RepID=A0A8H7WEB3_9HELO|nr:hypothetical protein IFR04_003621 [Cadophora malorum]
MDGGWMGVGWMDRLAGFCLGATGRGRWTGAADAWVLGAGKEERVEAWKRLRVSEVGIGVGPPQQSTALAGKIAQGGKYCTWGTPGRWSENS